MGLVLGLAAVSYVRMLYRWEDLFNRWTFPQFPKPAMGGLVVGLVLRFFPEVYGTGLTAMESALWGVRHAGARPVPGLDGGVRRLRDGWDGRLLRGRGKGPHDGDSHPFRDDQRLPHRATAHGGHGGQRVCFALAVAEQYLYTEAAQPGCRVPVHRTPG